MPQITYACPKMNKQFDHFLILSLSSYMEWGPALAIGTIEFRTSTYAVADACAVAIPHRLE